MHGHSEYTFEDGSYFEGMWHLGRPWKGLIEESGLFLDTLSISKYTGGLSEGKPHTMGFGEAKATYLNGDTYEGEYKEGNRHGKGLWLQTGEPGPAGAGSYEGTWKDDMPGEGFMEGIVGTIGGPFGRYTGPIKAGLREGGGSLFCRDGTVFAGYRNHNY